MYIALEEYDQFLALSDFSRNEVTKELIEKARKFHESDDLEELLLNALTDPNRTPHGPVEIADILTLQLSYRNKMGVAGIVLKGRSFSTIRPSHISHQIFRLRKISDLNFALFGHTGNLLDEAREELFTQQKTWELITQLLMPLTLLDLQLYQMYYAREMQRN